MEFGLSKAVAKVPHAPRDQGAITHSLRDLIAQGLYGLVRGYEDRNDHDRLIRRQRTEDGRQ
ncbi:MAG: transposase [Candidatus Accumulibacter sp.]|jgi:hypothetical protein|nr:transposase [Accumulibacter sp.]